MASKKPQILIGKGLIIASALAFVAGINPALAQTLKLRFPFDDAGPGTTTASDTSGGGLAVTLSMETSTPGTPVDLHGAAGSGIQGVGRSLNQSANPIAGNTAGSIAFVQNDANVSSLGSVSAFTATIWFKLVSQPTNTANQGPRFFLVGGNVTDSGVANSIALLFNTQAGNGFASNCIAGRINTTQFTYPLYTPMPLGVWQFLALTYDGSANASIYYGTEATPVKLMVINNIGAQAVDFTGGTVQIGNRLSGRNRPVAGSLDEFRFYTGVADATFVENVRKASCPVVISGLAPDGLTLQQGTSTLGFTASSANTIDTSAIKVSLNGTDISSSLVFGGTPSARTVSYGSLPVNPTLLNVAHINGTTLGIRVTDASGVIASNLYTYDSFSATNLTWEAEDYNYSTNDASSGGGNFIDNPRYAFVSAADTYYQRVGETLDDYDDNGGGAPRVYRNDAVANEFCLGAGINGGISGGELFRQKVIDAIVLDPTVRDVDVGFFDGTATPTTGLPNWMNYTRTFPTGPFNVYTRAASGGGTIGSTLALVTSGVGTQTQTTTNVGTFSFPNTGGWQSYAYVPLRDAAGNLVRLDLNGVATLRLTAGTAGGGNNNFLMIVPANTNLPSISGVYPNGTNMFQPSPTLSFTASSPTGVAISTNGIRVQLTVTTITRSFVTNITVTNGLTITGSSSNKNVSLPLITNATYVAVISVTDVIGSPAGQTVSFDTYAPALVWECEDYDYGGGQTYDPTNTVNQYSNAVGTVDIDFHDTTTAAGTHAYRPSDAAATEPNGDTPLRLAYIGTGFTDYDVGWYDNGDWNNYTRTIPSGQWNVIMRAANGTGGSGGVALATVTAGGGTTTQTTSPLGTFTIPATGGWQTYTWVPLRDTGGNLVKVVGTGAQQILRATSAGGNNANFYMLVEANTNQPSIVNVYPNGTSFFQGTNKLAFTVNAAGGATIATNNITVTLNGVAVTGLQFAGSPSTSWVVTYTNLVQNTNYAAVINVLDSNGNSASSTLSFDTFKPTYFTWEAEDYDYDNGQFFDNPQVDAYVGKSASADVDFHDNNTGGGYLYRPSGTATEITADTARTQFAGTNDYNIGFFGTGEWGNYTRHYPGGTYNVWGRFACGDANGSSAFLSVVTSGWGTTTQTTNYLGLFTVPTTSWSSFGWIPLRNDNGTMAVVSFDGTTNTLNLTRNPNTPNADVNVNFLMLVPTKGPVKLNAGKSGANVVISFFAQSGFTYQVEYKNNITDVGWTPLGGPITGDDTIKNVPDPATGTHRYYHVVTQ